MMRSLVHALLALVLASFAYAAQDAASVTTVSTKTLNEYFKPAVPVQIDSATHIEQMNDLKSVWHLASNKGNFDVEVEEDSSNGALSLSAVYSTDEHGSKTLIYQPSGTPTNWILGAGIILIFIGVITMTSSRPSSIARAPAPVPPPSSPKGSAEATNAAIRRRRSKLE
ncbi:hypothetical protein AC1031_010763 [Aphanomyces cochlioides]|nr:hypothetical protein AC1031_010763 [Aphanomyces cochlioides]